MLRHGWWVVMYSSSMICTRVRLSFPPFSHIFPSLPHLLSRNPFDRTDVLSSWYVNIYWHDSQQKGRGNFYILPFGKPSSSLSECAVHKNRKGLQFILDSMYFCSLGSCFCCRCHSNSCGRFISSWGDFPLCACLHHWRPALCWRKMELSDLLAFVSAEVNSTTVTLALLAVFVVLLYW